MFDEKKPKPGIVGLRKAVKKYNNAGKYMGEEIQEYMQGRAETHDKDVEKPGIAGMKKITKKYTNDGKYIGDTIEREMIAGRDNKGNALVTKMKLTPVMVYRKKNKK